MPRTDWAAIAKRFAANLTPERAADLARNLGLPVAAIAGVADAGFNPDDSLGPCWTIPLRNATGHVVGIMRRFATPVKVGDEMKNKLVMKGGHQGLVFAAGLANRSGMLCLPEGASDVFALTLTGLPAIGRPSNLGGCDPLAEFLRGSAWEPLVIGENDSRPSSTMPGETAWPGRNGAKVTAEKLAKAVGRPVKWALPPDGYKDAREWVCDLLDSQGEAEDYLALGAEIRKHLNRTATIAQPETATDESGEAKRPRWPDPVPVSALEGESAAVDWLWHGCIARRHTTLFSALMKAGKTTLVGHLLRSLQDGVLFCGRQTTRCRTLIVSEESKGLWRERRDALGLDDSLSVMCRAMVGKPNLAAWVDFVHHVRDCATKSAVDLVCIDTISSVAPWKNENDSAEVIATVTPLNLLTEAGLAVLLFHHHGKSDQSEGRAARGSTALAGAVDVLLDMRRFKSDDISDRRRVLSGLGRFDEIPDEIVVELAPDGSGFTAHGDRKAVAAQEIATAILHALPAEPPGATTTEVHEAMPKDDRPRRGDVGKVLNAGAGVLWTRAGAGKKGDPYRFWHVVS